MRPQTISLFGALNLWPSAWPPLSSYVRNNTQMKLLPDFKEFIDALRSAGADFLVIGAHALAAFGHPRYTGDLDIWIRRTPENSAKVEQALEFFGFSSLQISAKDLEVARMCFQLGYAPARIDILTDVSGLEFDACFRRRMMIDIDGTPTPFISQADFIVNKRAAGRTKDLADIEALQESPSSDS